MLCPRDQTELKEEQLHGIEVDHCPTCNGRWLDHHELDELEAGKATEEERRGMIQYAQRESELPCPVCGELMLAFNYRAYNIELDSCEQEHGFWLDAGEVGEVRDTIEERVRGLKRAATAEESWGKFLDGIGGKSGGGAFGALRGFFGGRRR
jgi:Zn-finger nucleic acid-binding protein